MDEALGQFGAMVAGALGGAVTDHAVAFGELTIITNTADPIKGAPSLRDEERCQFIIFIDVTVMVWPGRKSRSDDFYPSLPPKKTRRIRVKIAVDENTPVPS